MRATRRGGAVRLRSHPGTRHHMLLNSNETQLGSNLHLLNSVLSKTGRRLAYLDDEIARLRDRLVQLEEERASVSSFDDWNLGIISPLRWMPPEVLWKIFSWTLPSIQVALRATCDLSHSPWVLTQISGHWRAISLSAPSLWSLLVLNYPYYDEIGSPHSSASPFPLLMVKAQIQRAGKLHIRFYASEGMDSG
ncbi:hypothetical protein DFH07DRAFT_1018542 [Mycena maculata]|uniref:F-box domain-containing protein n=1 Tax=Mycena maculata TaxID=230809 RepID=A0AAD7JG84_9AGAR|nr:hypothetical protein DFH07DRAFT_1018542 [Mycena maculata]